MRADLTNIRWVAIFAVFCLVQLPYYVWAGRGPLGFDQSAKSAEKRLALGTSTAAELEGIQGSLDSGDQALETIGSEDSRRARLDLDLAILAWYRGDFTEADKRFRRSIEGFEKYHGPTAFYTSVVSLRYAEFLMLSRRYNEALPRFRDGLSVIDNTVGPDSPFALRMYFRQATLLVYMARYGEAKTLTSPRVQALLREAGNFDEGFLTQTADALQTLQTQTDFEAPAEGGNWREVLLNANRELRDKEEQSSDEG